MKNPFKAVSKMTAKSESVLLSRKDGYYYISNCFYLIRVPENIYTSEFMPASPRFIALEDGQNAASNSHADPIPRLTPGGNLSGFYGQADAALIRSPFIYDNDNGALCRVFMDGADVTYINETYYSTLAPLAGYDWRHKAGKRNSPIESENYSLDTFVLICPVNCQNNGSIQIVNTEYKLSCKIA